MNWLDEAAIRAAMKVQARDQWLKNTAITVNELSVPMGLTNPGGNSTAASLVEPVSRMGRPDLAAASSGVVRSGDGVIALGHQGSEAAAGVHLIFFGVGSSGQAFNANVYGWNEVINPSGSPELSLWVPTLLASFTGCTLDSNQPGVAGTPVSASNYFCTQITLNIGNAGISVEVVSPASNSGPSEIARVVIDGIGARFVEVRFNMNSSATSGNALWKRV